MSFLGPLRLGALEFGSPLWLLALLLLPLWWIVRRRRRPPAIVFSRTRTLA